MPQLFEHKLSMLQFFLYCSTFSLQFLLFSPHGFDILVLGPLLIVTDVDESIIAYDGCLHRAVPESEHLSTQWLKYGPNIRWQLCQIGLDFALVIDADAELLDQCSNRIELLLHLDAITLQVPNQLVALIPHLATAHPLQLFELLVDAVPHHLAQEGRYVVL